MLPINKNISKIASNSQTLVCNIIHHSIFIIKKNYTNLELDGYKT